MTVSASTASLRLAVYDALEESSHLTASELAQRVDSGAPVVEAQVRAVLRAEPTVFWPEEERWDLAIFHRFAAQGHLFYRRGSRAFDQDRFLKTVLGEAIHLKGEPIDLRTIAEKYLLKIRKSMGNEVTRKHFPADLQGILRRLTDFISSNSDFYLLRQNGNDFLWSGPEWPQQVEIAPPAYYLPADFLDRAFELLDKHRQPMRLLDILQELLGIDASHSDFSVAFAQANSALDADKQSFAQVQEQAWMLAHHLPQAIEEIPARTAIPRWRNPYEEKLVDALYAQWPVAALEEAKDFVDEEAQAAAGAGFDENFFGELRFVLPYRWRQAGVLKVNARERRLFPDRPARAFLQFQDQYGGAFSVWLNNESGYLYGLQDWYAANLVPAGGVFYLQRSPGSKYNFKVRIQEAPARTFDGRQYFCEVDPDTYIEETRLHDLEALRAKVEAAQATVKDVVCDVFESSGPEAELHYKQVWAQVHVVRPTTRRTVASILSAFPCFYQTQPGSGLWRYTSGLRQALPKPYQTKHPAKAASKSKPAFEIAPRPVRYWLTPVRADSWETLARRAEAGDDVYLAPWRGRTRVGRGDQLAFFDGKSRILLAAAEVLREPVQNDATNQRELAVRPLLPAFRPAPYDDLAGSLSVPRPEADGSPVSITLEDMQTLLQHLRPLAAFKPVEPTLEELIDQVLPGPDLPDTSKIIPHTFGPNPTIGAFIAKYGRPYDPQEPYSRSAFASPVKAGKNTAIYNAHSYHTKVPPQGIEPYIEHYTQPGDIVLDPFCGSGMTGVAALKLGRRVILNDLSPAATHIAYNYCAPVDVDALKREFERIKAAVKEEFDWLYGTTCDRCGGSATVQYTIWSDVYECGAEGCGEKIVLWDMVVDPQTGEIHDNFECPLCGTKWRKTQLRWLHSEPVITNYECLACKPKRAEHVTTSAERTRIVEIEATPLLHWYPTIRIDRDLDLWYERDYRKIGVYAIDDFYTKRNLRGLSLLWYEINQVSDERSRRMLVFAFTSIANAMTKMYRYRSTRKGGITEGTLYIPSLSQEMNVLSAIRSKVESFYSLFATQIGESNSVVLQTTTATDLQLMPSESIDYTFTDPPYGSNIIYSDLSIIWEAWLGQYTDASREAVIHRRRKGNPSTLETYSEVMRQSFAEMFRVLKPGRWASVVFHNTDDRVWRTIQQAVLDVGFEIVNAQAFDKEQGSFKQVTSEGAANFDIVLNLHRPSMEPTATEMRPADDLSAFVFERIESFLQSGPPPDHRTTQYLHSLILRQFLNGNLIIEQITIPYLERLLPTRVRKINDRWYLQREAVVPTGHGFLVRSETAAVAWLEHILAANPQSEADLIPQWQIATLGAGSRIRPSLGDLLKENFWPDDAAGVWTVPTPAQREILRRRRARPQQLVLGLEIEEAQLALGLE